ncbi:MAG: phytanoyl-CoA dioxygenase family protein [Pseudomonadota bacterium]
MTAAPATRPAPDFSEVRYAPLTPSSLLEADATLRARFQEEGYLYLPGAAPDDGVSQLLNEFLAVLDPHARWSNETDSPVLHGEPFFETDELWDALYPKVQALESLHALFHSPALLSLMARIRDAEPFVYPMKMARIAAPRKLGYETPPHQDAFSHHAGPTMAGLWIALHNVDAAMGRLTLLPGSHKDGVRPVFEAQGVGGVQCEIYPHETLWHVSDVKAGDVIIFHSQTVHRAQPNTDERRVRLSVDTRFCDYGARVFSTNLEPHHGWRIPELDWGYVYRGWERRDLKYYWNDYPALF